MNYNNLKSLYTAMQPNYGSNQVIEIKLMKKIILLYQLISSLYTKVLTIYSRNMKKPKIISEYINLWFAYSYFFYIYDAVFNDKILISLQTAFFITLL
jgi:hypothetical protein